MGELPQYHIAQLARRIYGSKIAPRSEHLAEATAASNSGKYDTHLKTLMKMGEEELRRLYQEREVEPEIAAEDWVPNDTGYL